MGANESSVKGDKRQFSKRTASYDMGSCIRISHPKGRNNRYKVLKECVFLRRMLADL